MVYCSSGVRWKIVSLSDSSNILKGVVFSVKQLNDSLTDWLLTQRPAFLIEWFTLNGFYLTTAFNSVYLETVLSCCLHEYLKSDFANWHILIINYIDTRWQKTGFWESFEGPIFHKCSVCICTCSIRIHTANQGYFCCHTCSYYY